MNIIIGCHIATNDSKGGKKKHERVKKFGALPLIKTIVTFTMSIH